MTVHANDMTGLANAYREALRAGDQRFAGNLLEKKILQAVIAASAADTARWVRTRSQDGDAAAKPLEALVPDLERGNHLGKGLEVARTKAFSAAKGAVLSVVTTGLFPVWVTSVIAFLAGLFGMAQEAGFALGSFLITAAAGGGAVIFGLLRLAQASAPAVTALGTAASNLYDAASRIGSPSEGLYKETVAPVLGRIRTDGQPSAPVVGQLRGSAQLLVGATYALAAFCALVFLIGAFQAFEAWSASVTTVPTVPSTSLG